MDKYMNANIVFSKFARSYMELKKDLPIRPSEMAVLNIIIQQKGKFTPIMIAELLGVSKPMMTAHIRVLLKKGYISKVLSENDKRSFYILPTDKAVALADKFNGKQTEYIKAIETALGKSEFEQLVNSLGKAVQTLETQTHL